MIGPGERTPHVSTACSKQWHTTPHPAFSLWVLESALPLPGSVKDVFTFAYRKFGKRILDVLIAVSLLLVLTPVLVLIALTVWLIDGTPVLFRQNRPGYRGKPFTLLKFRTMRNAVAADGRPLGDAERLTRLGRLLRQTSLDELPSLLNVLLGEMSIVGPRPLLMEYLDRYTPEQARRHDVRPGITGWAQVHGRRDVLFSKRLELDVWYVQHGSLAVDLRILAATLLRVLLRDGVRLEQNLCEVDDLELNRGVVFQGTRATDDDCRKVVAP